MRATMLALMFKLATSAEQSFRRLKGFAHLAKIIAGVRFVDGVEQIEGGSETQQSRRLIKLSYTRFDDSSFGSVNGAIYRRVRRHVRRGPIAHRK